MPNRCDENAACIDGTCHCDQSSAQKDDSCIPKQLGDQLKNCTSNQGICSGGMYCLKGVCVCPTGQHLIHGSCASTEPQFNVHLHHSTKPLKNPFIPFPTQSPTPLMNLIKPIGYPDLSSFANSQLFHKSPLNRFHRDANQAQHSNFLSYPFITGASALPFPQFDNPNNNPIINHDQGNYFYPTFNNIPMNNNYPVLVTFNNALFGLASGPGSACFKGCRCDSNLICTNGFCICPYGQKI
ncbi:unnamed protein product, partial [Anisakis simplex]|uniref:EB domain-containing protein n=1 Tax=Anisakis simplex TaxID=6269 RepID=A0A0M3J5U7_ANISI